MAKQFIQIFCKVSRSLWLGLSGVRENYGHDDSLPYQADVFVMDKLANPEGQHSFKRIGSIWNDGWGGDSVFESAELKDSYNYEKALETACAKHKMYYNGKPFADYDLCGACDMMASAYVDLQNDAEASKKIKDKTLLWKFDDEPFCIENPDKFPVFIYNETL